MRQETWPLHVGWLKDTKQPPILQELFRSQGYGCHGLSHERWVSGDNLLEVYFWFLDSFLGREERSLLTLLALLVRGVLFVL